MSAWHLLYQDWQPAQERLREALCTTGNGYFATRGAAPEAPAGEHHYPGTYVAGLYNRLATEIAGRKLVNESLVNVPNWLPLDFCIEDGDWFRLDEVDLLDYCQVLDLRQGVLRRELTFRGAGDRETRLEQWRLVHLDRIHLAVLCTRIVARNWSGRIRVRSALDGRVRNEGVERYSELNSRHLETLERWVLGPDTMALYVKTNDSGVLVAQVAATRLYRDGERVDATPAITERSDYIAQTFELDLEQDRPLDIEKTVALHTSRDKAGYRPDLDARRNLAAAPRPDDLRRDHAVLWDQLWRRFSFSLDLGDEAEEERTLRILRLHVFHLLQTCGPAAMDLDVSVPARGLHGEAYRGHVFWDELFIFPFLNLRIPNITRALLKYRYRRLEEARRAAREAGYHGAMYPWQSGSDGREESQRLHLNPRSGRWLPDNSRRQRHVNVAIAYNVFQYFEVTQDREFLAYVGAEMLLEIARFWSSIAELNPERGRYEIRGVMGPDEYHDAYPGRDGGGLDNNAYTNLMVAWVLGRVLDLPDMLGEQRWNELCEMLEVSDSEVERWHDITRKMFVPFHDGDIISQFEGYEALEEFDWEAYRQEYEDIQRLDRILESEGDTPNRYKLSKQADVLMLFYLLSAEDLEQLFDRLGYDFDPEIIPRNINYYLSRTSHGSTLSRVVHSWVLARSSREGAWKLFADALESDVADIQGGTTSEGIHAGAMAGTVDLMQRCFTGIETRGGVLWLNPRLPDRLRRLELQIHYRQQVLTLSITRETLRVASEPGDAAPVRIGFDDETESLAPGQRREFELGPAAARAD